MRVSAEAAPALAALQFPAEYDLRPLLPQRLQQGERARRSGPAFGRGNAAHHGHGRSSQRPSDARWEVCVGGVLSGELLRRGEVCGQSGWRISRDGARERGDYRGDASLRDLAPTDYT